MSHSALRAARPCRLPASAVAPSLPIMLKLRRSAAVRAEGGGERALNECVFVGGFDEAAAAAGAAGWQ